MFTRLPPARRRDHPGRSERDRPRLLVARRLRHRVLAARRVEVRGERPTSTGSGSRPRSAQVTRADVRRGGRAHPSHRSQPRREGRDRRGDRARPPARAAHAARLARERARAAPRRGEPPRGLPPAAPDRSRAGRDVRRQLLLDRSASATARSRRSRTSSTSQLDPAQYSALSHRRPHRRATATRCSGTPTSARGPRGGGRASRGRRSSGRRRSARVCFFRQDWVSPDGDGRARRDELRLEPVRDDGARGAVGPATASARGAAVARSRRPRPGPTASCSPHPGQRSGRCEFDRDPDDLAIEFDDRFTAPGPGAQLAVWLDDRQVLRDRGGLVAARPGTTRSST